MSTEQGKGCVQAIKDEESERPIPTAWRQTIKDIVKAFAQHDYQISVGVESVTAVSSKTAEQIRDYVEDYGEELTELSDETWESSVCIWMGHHWDAIVDLWTLSEGRSDLVLNLQVTEKEPGFEYEIGLLYVP